MSLFPRLSLSVVIPVYNEADLVRQTIRRSVESLARIVGEFEILLIDDCSTDGTAAAADDMERDYPQVRAFHNPENMRQGGALRVGFGLARHELVMHNAIDYPFDFQELPKVLELLPSADVIVVMRREYAGVSLGRKFSSWTNRALIRSAFGMNIRDYNFVQVFQRAALMQEQSFSTATAFITVERIVRAHFAGFRVAAVEAGYRPRPAGSSTSGRFRVVRDSLRDMIRLWIELRFRRRSRSALSADGGSRP